MSILQNLVDQEISEGCTLRVALCEVAAMRARGYGLFTQALAWDQMAAAFDYPSHFPLPSQERLSVEGYMAKVVAMRPMSQMSKEISREAIRAHHTGVAAEPLVPDLDWSYWEEGLRRNIWPSVESLFAAVDEELRQREASPTWNLRQPTPGRD